MNTEQIKIQLELYLKELTIEEIETELKEVEEFAKGLEQERNALMSKAKKISDYLKEQENQNELDIEFTFIYKSNYDYEFFKNYPEQVKIIQKNFKASLEDLKIIRQHYKLRTKQEQANTSKRGR